MLNVWSLLQTIQRGEEGWGVCRVLSKGRVMRGVLKERLVSDVWSEKNLEKQVETCTGDSKKTIVLSLPWELWQQRLNCSTGSCTRAAGDRVERCLWDRSHKKMLISRLWNVSVNQPKEKNDFCLSTCFSVDIFWPTQGKTNQWHLLLASSYSFPAYWLSGNSLPWTLSDLKHLAKLIPGLGDFFCLDGFETLTYLVNLLSKENILLFFVPFCLVSILPNSASGDYR